MAKAKKEKTGSIPGYVGPLYNNYPRPFCKEFNAQGYEVDRLDVYQPTK